MVLQRIKYISIFLFFLFCFGLSIKIVNDGNARLGWAGVALWGVMSVLSMYSLIHDCFTAEAKARFLEEAQMATPASGKSKSEGLKAHLVSIWTIFAAISIGTASGLLSERIQGRVIPPIAVWLCSFFFTLLFFPFQHRKKESIPSFPVWVVYCAAMGFVSIVFFYMEDWLR